MKKLYTLFLFIFFSILGFSQQEVGEYKIEFTVDRLNFVRYGNTGGHMWVRVQYDELSENGSIVDTELVSLEVGDNASKLGEPNVLKFSSKNKIVKISSYSIDRNRKSGNNDDYCGPYYDKYRRTCGISQRNIKYPSGTIIDPNLGIINTGRTLLRNSNNITNDEEYPVLMDFSNVIFLPSYRDGYVFGTIDILPNLKLKRETTISTFLPIQDKIKIYAPDGFDPQEYNWEYSLDTNNWISLIQYNGQSSLTISAYDLLGNNANNLLNKPIYIRTTAYKYGALAPLVISNILTYTIEQSSPHITRANPQNTLCYDSTDGQVKFSFDRELNPNETLNLIIVDLDKPTTSIEGVQHYETVASKVNIDILNEKNTTFTNLAAGNYRLELIGKYNGEPTFTDGATHTIGFTIKKPDPVSFDMVKITDIRCNGGQDGVIELTASGGQGNYLYQVEYPNKQVSEWISFTSGNTTQLTRLNIGLHKIQVKDSNGCISKEIIKDQGGNIIGLGAGITQTVTLTQPTKAVTINYVDFKNSTAFGLTNGYIKANITGGTPYNNPKLYIYTWKYEDGTSWTNITEEEIAGNEGWFLTLNNAKAGKYILTVTDANYNESVDKEGCTVFESEFVLTQPDPLKATIEISQPISCNTSNEYGDETDQDPMDGQRDESQNGTLIARVTGGIKPYIYTWKKQTNGIWTTLTTQTNKPEFSLAYNLSDGNYAFNVKDANGIVLGEYVNNQLVAERDKIIYLKEPAQLTLEARSTEVSCNPGNNGSIQVTVKGGIAPYTYTWTNGETTSEIKNLIAGIYKVIVTDARGCRIERNIVLSQPGEIEIKEVVINPTCYGGSDGSISVSVIGGGVPYIYEWSTGETTSRITNLKEEIYTLKVTDAKGCIAIKNIEIQNPEQIKVNLGTNRTLCNGQNQPLDATISDTKASYQWTSTTGFTSNSPKVILEEAGTYKVIVTTSLGCTLTDEITISRSNTDINSEFLLTSQAYVNEEVILVNVSNPLGQTTDWAVPNAVQVLNKNDREIVVKFSQKGTYKIGLTSTQGGCYEYYEKNIIVEENRNLPDPGATDNPFIQEFTLAPNPNDGNFQIKVKLAEKSSVSLRIFDISGALVSGEKKLEGNREYEINYQLSNLGTATYIIVLETAKGTKVKRMITY